MRRLEGVIKVTDAACAALEVKRMTQELRNAKADNAKLLKTMGKAKEAARQLTDDNFALRLEVEHLRGQAVKQI